MISWSRQFMQLTPSVDENYSIFNLNTADNGAKRTRQSCRGMNIQPIFVCHSVRTDAIGTFVKQLPHLNAQQKRATDFSAALFI